MTKVIFYFCIVFCFTRAESFERQPISCSSDSYPCGDKTKCVKGRSLCDYVKDCEDFSDERLSLCKKFQEKRGPCREPGQLYHSDYGCKEIIDICSSDHYNTKDPFKSLCDEVKGGLAPNLDFNAKDKEIEQLREQVSTLEEQTSLKGVFESVARGFGDSMCSTNDSDCPWLYGKINGKCMALFTAAKLTWYEAKEFCESVKGTLAILDNMNDYQAVLQHLRHQELTTDLWIGGRFVDSKTMEKSGWKWLDEKDITMGVPFWSQYFPQRSDFNRPPWHPVPTSDMRSNRLKRASGDIPSRHMINSPDMISQSPNCNMRGTSPICYTFSLAPRENRDGFCLSLDYAFHYYFIDQICHKKRSPLCILNKN